MREKISAAINRAEEDRNSRGYDMKMQPHSPDHRAFVENDGDAGNAHLGMRIKEAHSGDKMPSVDNAYETGKRPRFI